MTELKIADTPLLPVALGLDQRVTLGPRTDAPGEQADRISLGRPAVVPLDINTVDADGRVFLQGRPSSTFLLLALTCSFRAVEEEPIEQAWIEVQLRTLQPADSEDPTAWSMEPLSLTSLVQLSEVTKLDASLKLTSPVVPIEFGPDAGREKTEVVMVSVPFVEAHREGTSRPAWIFSRTKIVEVRGVHRLRTVISLPAGATARAEVSAGATLRLKRLGLIPYKALLDQLPEHQVAQLKT
jgi:hypothetical protein